jgi:creatinine deaminase
MCTGACVMYGVKRVVIGYELMKGSLSYVLLTIHSENKTFLGGEAYLKQRGIVVVVLDNGEGKELMAKFIEEKPEEWYEDIGEKPPKKD